MSKPHVNAFYRVEGCGAHDGHIVKVLENLGNCSSLVEGTSLPFYVTPSHSFRFSERNDCLVRIEPQRVEPPGSLLHAGGEEVRTHLRLMLKVADDVAARAPDTWPTVIDILRNAIKSVIDGGAE